MTPDEQLANAIEALLDAHSLHRLLDALGTICDEKAEHIKTTWDDPRTAAIWTAAASRIRIAANARPVMRLS